MKALILVVVTLLAIGHVQAQGPKCPMTKTAICVPGVSNEYYFCRPGAAAGSDATKRICAEATPFCNVRAGGDLCLSTIDERDPKCGTEAEGAYQCTGNGYFPDPLNCCQYHICYNDDHVAIQCPQRHYYNSYEKDCVNDTSTCYSVDCSKQTTDFAPYQPNGQYYVDCYDNKLPVLYRCAAGELFDILHGCQFICPGAGRFAHETKTKYYNCLEENAIGRLSNCPGGSTFNPNTGLCNVNFLLMLQQEAAAAQTDAL